MDDGLGEISVALRVHDLRGPDRTWTVSPGETDRDRTVSRDGVVVASWWGPALTIADAADPLDTSVAVALHHARL